MNTAESVTVSSLEASVNLEGHSEFLTALLSREDLGLPRKAWWMDRLGEVRERSQEPDLYLAVVGEFSSGKSTLVNALIRETLLPADVLPGTTSAAVLVRFGTERRLRVEYLDGRTNEITDGDIIRAEVERLITVEETARTVARVSIDHPAAMLREGLVAVDLPGSNVENTRHTEVAGQTIRDLCCTALVAIPAHSPVSESLAEFLRGHLDGVLHRCIFIVTKIDQ
ncbi:MAG TPA: dynamin family protein, partial [Thermoanaerobaculia bacterium]|nr:dynamin family protein [Thermoanaerobaculia bacterium]